ncbi:putative NOT transcription complex subunit VIP2 [Dendrobium catenatum]|uniref:Putative NOT transcription complex subunit VIP2 n=1 Tax=Dendrobium catenatum TaxID=906689 RepID=A0A2I0W6X3_9ASPA|nr:putative NOT transcription complex subunit VIP2 [Dendrobium catenatum]
MFDAASLQISDDLHDHPVSVDPPIPANLKHSHTKIRFPCVSIGSLRKQGISSIVQQNQEFSIQNEDFPALPEFKGGSSDFSLDLHQKEQLHENVSMLQSQHFPGDALTDLMRFVLIGQDDFHIVLDDKVGNLVLSDHPHLSLIFKFLSHRPGRYLYLPGRYDNFSSKFHLLNFSEPSVTHRPGQYIIVLDDPIELCYNHLNCLN